MKAEDILVDFDSDYFEGNVYGELAYKYEVVIQAMEKYGEEVLKIAAEKAKTKKKEIPYEGVRAGGSYYIDIVDKESIIECLK